MLSNKVTAQCCLYKLLLYNYIPRYISKSSTCVLSLIHLSLVGLFHGSRPFLFLPLKHQVRADKRRLVINMASLRQSTPTLLPNDVGTIFSVESYHTFYRSPLLPISVTVIILAASYYALVRYLTPSATPDIAVPLLFSQLDDKTRADKYINDCLSILKEGYASFKDNSLGLYRMTTADSTEVVILHPKYLPELRDLPDPYLSFAHAIEKHLAGKWAHIADNM